MKLWLDDVRPAPDGWTLVRTVPEAVKMIEQGGVECVSLDNDLGACEPEGYIVADWIEAQAHRGLLRRIGLFAHTHNTVARDRMLAAFKNAKRMWEEQERALD